MKDTNNNIQEIIDKLYQTRISPLDLLPQKTLREKIVGLLLEGLPDGLQPEAKAPLDALRKELLQQNSQENKIVVFGGGSGLSNIVGGDSRRADWSKKPFEGLKNLFPHIKSIVCVTDDGGSTGELLKDFPLMALGDIRHVLVSSIQRVNLQTRYGLNRRAAQRLIGRLADVFNWRFTEKLTAESSDLQQCRERLHSLPPDVADYLLHLTDCILTDPRFQKVRSRPHCFGNLLCAAAIIDSLPDGTTDFTAENFAREKIYQAVLKGLNSLSTILGAGEYSVLPCTPTPAQLRILYANNVEIVGENKLVSARRGFPIQRVSVDYCDTPYLYPRLVESIQSADIIIFAPGSLYSSVIPVLQVPGLAQAVRENTRALKVLVSNLWVQTGETDVSMINPERKFQVSDMLEAYEKNIPGGTRGLFQKILCVSLRDIPASILQNYAVEGKVPIYLDREKIIEKQYDPVECEIYSRDILLGKGIIQHDPARLALAVKGLFAEHSCCREKRNNVSQDAVQQPSGGHRAGPERSSYSLFPHERYAAIEKILQDVTVNFIGDPGQSPQYSEQGIKESLLEVIWAHPLIPLKHLQFFSGVHCVGEDSWNRNQKWDNVFSFYDPDDRCIKIRADQILRPSSFEVAFMIALGESLLGSYASVKRLEDVVVNDLTLGRVYHLWLRPEEERCCYFAPEELRQYLLLSRMCPTDDPHHYTRLVNKNEGFTPPGLLMGLMYAWYLDNRMATHIEYKMSVLKIQRSTLIPEQLKMALRRENMIGFFKNVIFRRNPS